MLTSNYVDDLAKRLCSALPNGLQLLDSEIQQQFKAILQATFARLELVTREEFDVQVHVLARTREKVEALQAQVDALLQESQ